MWDMHINIHKFCVHECYASMHVCALCVCPVPTNVRKDTEFP